MSASAGAKAKGYDGPVAVCAARYVPISGHQRESPGDQVHGREQGPRGLARADRRATGCWMPFRVSVRTMIGTTVVEAQEFRSGEVGRRHRLTDGRGRVQRAASGRIEASTCGEALCAYSVHSSASAGIGMTPTPSSIKRPRLVEARPAADRPLGFLAGMDGARDFGKLRADVVGVRLDLLPAGGRPFRGPARRLASSNRRRRALAAAAAVAAHARPAP